MPISQKVLQGSSGGQTSPDSELLSSNGMVAGETISQWTQDWWTWTLQSPFATSAQLDTTGAFASSGNFGSMFFLAGSFTSSDVPVTRTFDVPANTPLLVPVLNNIAIQFTGKGPDPLTGGKGGGNIVTTDWMKSVTDLFLKIDGQSVSSSELQSDLIRTDWFSAGTTQPGSLAEAFGIVGDISPSKSVGYWAVVKGFAAGTTHTIEFGGKTSAGFSLDIKDTVTAV